MQRLVSTPLIGISYTATTADKTNESLLKLMDQFLNVPYITINHFQIVPDSDDLEKIYSNISYLSKVIKHAKCVANDYLDQIHGLIIPGNAYRVDPRLFGEKIKNQDKHKINLSRAIAELALIHAALQRGMPILAICGGHQILNVYFGGKLSRIKDEDIVHQGFLDYSPIKFDVDSEMAKIFGLTSTNHTSLFFGAHKFIVSQLGGKNMVMGDDFFTVAGNAVDNNNSIEAMEPKHGATAPIYSMQFHPEVSVIGMHSNLHHDTRYYAPNREIAEKNLNIILAFLTATKTYQAKKIITPTSLNKTNKTLQPDNILTQNGKNASTKPIINSLLNFFNETTSSSIKNIEKNTKSHIFSPLK